MRPDLVEVDHQKLDIRALAALFDRRRAVRHQILLALKFELVDPNPGEIAHFRLADVGVRANGVHRVLDGQLQRFPRFLDVDAERALEVGFHDLIIDQKRSDMKSIRSHCWRAADFRPFDTHQKPSSGL